MNDQYGLAELNEQTDESAGPSLFARRIAYFDKLIRSRTATPADKAVAYHHRGQLYFSNEEYDRALLDYRKSIGLDKTFAEAYAGCGDVYMGKGHYDRAIKSYTAAISRSKNRAGYYERRGAAYHRKSEHAKAKRNYSQAIALDEKYVKSFHSRGMLHVDMGEYDKAIDDFTAAVRLGTADPETYLQRSTACILSGAKGSSSRIFKDQLKANELSEGALGMSNAYCHVAGKISQLAAQLGLETRLAYELNFCFGKLIAAIDALQSRLQFKFETPSMLGHYSSLVTLRKLAGGEAFRVFNSAYMNDSREGQAFFEAMAQHGVDVEGLFYGIGGGADRVSPAYIGSFVEIDKADQEVYHDGRLLLWSLYGKHDREDATGACLLFDERQFEKGEAQLKIGGMPNAPQSAELEAEATVAATVNADLPVVYQVVYLKQAGKFKAELLAIAAALKELEAALKRHQTPLGESGQQQLFGLAGKTLDSIRFLFKTDHYSEEREARIVKLSYHTEDEPQPTPPQNQANATQPVDGRKPEHRVEVQGESPIFYMNLPSLKFQEVILGPKAGKLDEWQQWLSDQGNRCQIRKSAIPFG